MRFGIRDSIATSFKTRATYSKGVTVLFPTSRLNILSYDVYPPMSFDHIQSTTFSDRFRDGLAPSNRSGTFTM